MKCVICKHGKTQSGTVTVTLERDNTTVVIKNVSAQICENCGESYIDEDTTDYLLKTAENAAAATNYCQERRLLPSCRFQARD